VEEGPVAVPEATEKAMRYYRSGNWLWWIGTAWGLLIPTVLLFSGFSARMRSLAQRIGHRWFLVVAIYLVLYLILDYVLSLPLSYYQGFVRQHAYELSNQTFAKWFGDSIKGLFVGVIAVVLFGWVPFLLLKRSPRRWWLYTGLAAIPFLFFMILVTPIWVSPMFNDFGPMEDKQLEADILALADRAGIEGSRVFQVNKSVDTEAVNAYVTGFLNTKRIVLWDTILDKLDREELLFVMAHEMGHYVLKHVISSIFFFSALIILVLYAIYRSAGALIARHGKRFGFQSLDDVASLPLILLLVNVYFFVLAPVTMGFSRYHEHESDRFGLELTQRNRPAASAFVKLQQENLGNPRPGILFKLWRATHPPLGERIDFCNEYRPWETGGEMRYADRFAEAPTGSP
jgi:Zn-dependent protease with chaperone function